MLQQVCEYLLNYFVLDEWGGDYEIVNGAITPAPPLKEGQRFLIKGSALNDGVYTWHAAGITNDDSTEGASLMDETFTGTVCGMGVPPAVIAIAGEITDWQTKYGEAVNSPYSSETVIGVYSYTKGRGSASGAGDTTDITWQKVFASRLKRWKKVCL